MIYGYYPGCCLQSTCKDFDTSVRAVLETLGIELKEIRRWTCCGSSATHAASRRLAVALPLANLAKAQKQGFEDVLVPCAACFARFKFAWHEIEGDAKLRQEMEDVLRHRFTERVKIVHPLELFAADDMLKRIAASKKRDISALKVVCYYGCLLVRPRVAVGIDDAEDPQRMDRLIAALGAETIDWAFKTECCGASLPLTRPEIVMKLSHRILSQAKQGGADCIATACPMCHSNLDIHQEQMRAVYKDDFGLPVFYFTQLVGLALGFSPQQMLLERHFTNPLPMLKSKGLA